jgi:rubrerythrin
VDYIDIINKGIQLEDEAYHFYTSQAKRHVEVEKLFSSLAIEELKHRRLLEHFKKTNDFMEAERRVNQENILGLVPLDDQAPVLYSDLSHVIDTAISMEVQAFELYASIYKESVHSDVMNLLRTLMDMELRHAELLKERFKK